MIARSHSAASRNNGGHTLIELMVAIIIGLLLVLAAFQVMAVFEGHKRSTTAVNDALQSANFGLLQMDTLARSSGTGIVQMAKYAYGCPLNFTTKGGTGTPISDGTITLPAPFDKVLTTPSTIQLRLAPAVIFPSATTTGNSDVLLLMSGGDGFAETPVAFTAAAAGKQLQLTHTVGFFANDWVLVSQNAVNPATAASCMATKVDAGYVAETAANSTGNVALLLTQSAVGAATLASYGSDAVVTSLGTGQEASFLMYGVDDTDYTLKSVDLLNGDLTAPQLVSDDVVTIRAVYGINNVGPGALTWVKPVDSGANLYSPAKLLDGTDAARTRLRSIKAIRIAVVVRAPLSERTAASDTAITTSNAVSARTFTLFTTLPSSVQTTWNAPAAQPDYRFRELEATIPLRNASF